MFGHKKLSENEDELKVTAYPNKRKQRITRDLASHANKNIIMTST